MENAKFFISFAGSIFTEESEIKYDAAKAVLESLLNELRRIDEINHEITPQAYLNTWCKEGFLRETDGVIFKTDACEQAIRFVTSLSDTSYTTTKSRLSNVQDEIKSLALDTNPDTKKRIDMLVQERNAIDMRIKSLRDGNVETLSEYEVKERIKNIISLAEGLPRDFRKLVEEMRTMDRSLREKMIEDSGSRGAVLRMLLDNNEALSNSEAGMAFKGFYDLLVQSDQKETINQQIKAILSLPVSASIEPNKRKALTHLFRDLNRESAQIRRVRKTMGQKLKVYIRSDTVKHKKQVTDKLNCIAKLGLLITQSNVPVRTPTNLTINTGSLSINSVALMRPRPAEANVSGENIVAQVNSTQLDNNIVDLLDTVSKDEIIDKIKDSLTRNGGVMTLGDIIKENPLSQGMSELVMYVHVAQTVNTTELDEKEEVLINHTLGLPVLSKVNTFVFSISNFPDRNEEIIV
jgi:hypothetical protein